MMQPETPPLTFRNPVVGSEIRIPVTESWNFAKTRRKASQQIQKNEKKKYVNLTGQAEEISLPNIESFSSWLKLITVIVLKVTKREVNKFVKFECNARPSAGAAEELWWEKFQLQYYLEELNILSSNLQYKNKEQAELTKNSKLYKLSRFLDRHGVIITSSRGTWKLPLHWTYPVEPLEATTLWNWDNIEGNWTTILPQREPTRANNFTTLH